MLAGAVLQALSWQFLYRHFLYSQFLPLHVPHLLYSQFLPLHVPVLAFAVFAIPAFACSAFACSSIAISVFAIRAFARAWFFTTINLDFDLFLKYFPFSHEIVVKYH